MSAKWYNYLLDNLEHFIQFLASADVWNGVSYLDFIVVTAIVSMCLTTLLYKGRT